MPLTEPMTMATDFALGALSAGWSMSLARIARRDHQRSVAWWSASFASFALASIVGGAYHGFAHDLAPRTLTNLWTLVTLAMGLGSFLMLCAAIVAATASAWRRTLLAAAVIKLVLFAILVAGSESFLLLVLDYGTAQLAILVLAAFSWQRERAPSAPWLVAGIATSALGAVVQQSGFALHANFNHNDIYHVIQMLGLYLLYRGGALFCDRA